MKKEVIRVFLGGFINETNAQNLSCKLLAERLDRDKFEIYTLTKEHGDLGRVSIPGVKIFHCYSPVKLFQLIGFLWGIILSDVAYLPKANFFQYQRLLVKLFKRKSFKTVENVIDKESIHTALGVLGSVKRIVANYSFTTRTYSITNFMKEYNYQNIDLATEECILPVPIDTYNFSKGITQKSELRDLLFYGNAMKRKKAKDFVSLAQTFPQLNFHIVGKSANNYLTNDLAIHEVVNLKYHGLLAQSELIELMKGIQMHILPSRSEGFPKGIIECAAAGIPSIVYSDYGASEWIEHGKEGFVCDDLEEMEGIIRQLFNNPELLKSCSLGALDLANRFSAQKVVLMYEEEIEDIFNS
jgi:glycosyltransferase involved in cell wall biosynthesis